MEILKKLLMKWIMKSENLLRQYKDPSGTTAKLEAYPRDKNISVHSIGMLNERKKLNRTEEVGKRCLAFLLFKSNVYLTLARTSQQLYCYCL